MSAILKTINEYVPASLLAFAVLSTGFYFLIKFLKKQDFNNKKNGAIIAIYSAISLIILLFLIRFWPPSNVTETLIAEGGGGGGMTINFGDTEQGMGNDYQNEELNTTPEKQTETLTEEAPNEVLTQDDGADVATPAKNPIKVKNQKTKDITQPISPKVVEKKPNSALANMMKGKHKGGDGNTTTAGNQGSRNSTKLSDGYYGNGQGGNGKGGGNGNGNGSGPGSGNGNGGSAGANFSLAGRRTIIKPAVDNDCNAFGKVVINITVDKSGKTIAANNGKGTNADACLIKLATQFALRTKWDASENAAEKQTGTITYIFKN